MRGRYGVPVGRPSGRLDVKWAPWLSQPGTRSTAPPLTVRLPPTLEVHRHDMPSVRQRAENFSHAPGEALDHPLGSRPRDWKTAVEAFYIKSTAKRRLWTVGYASPLLLWRILRLRLDFIIGTRVAHQRRPPLGHCCLVAPRNQRRRSPLTIGLSNPVDQHTRTKLAITAMWCVADQWRGPGRKCSLKPRHFRPTRTWVTTLPTHSNRTCNDLTRYNDGGKSPVPMRVYNDEERW